MSVQKGYVKLDKCGLPRLSTFSQDVTLAGKVGWYSLTITRDCGKCTTYTIAESSIVNAGAGLYLSGEGNDTINVGTASTDRIVVNADNIDLATTGVTAGIYTRVTVDDYGRVTFGDDHPTALSLDDLTDVTLTSPQDGDLLQYNGSMWVNSASSGLFWNLSGNEILSSYRLGSTNEVDLTIITNNIDVITVNTDGEVGIGTALPFGRLHLHSDNVSNTGYPSMFITTMNSGGKYSAIGHTPGSRIFSIQNTHEPSIDEPEGGSVHIYTNSIQALVVNQDQQVIVGADGVLSADKFQVDGSSYTKGITIDIASKGVGKLLQSDANGTGTWGILSSSYVDTFAFVQNGNSFGALAVLGTNDNFNLAFETNSTTKMTLTTDGKLLINNTTGVYKLTVHGSSAAAAGYDGIQTRNLTSTGYGLIGVTNDDGTKDVHLFSRNSAAAARLGTSDVDLTSNGFSQFSIGTFNAAILSFHTTAIERARFTSGGRFLINSTTDTGEQVQITGTVRITPASGITTVWAGAGVITHTNTNNTSGGFAILNTNTGSGAGSYIQIGTRTAVGVATSAYFFKNSGNAASGTIHGPNDCVLSNDAGGGNFIFNNDVSSGRYAWFINTSEKMRLLSNGRLLLGTTTDNGELAQINGTVRIIPGTNATSIWGSGGMLTITANSSTIEDALNIKTSSKTQFLKLGTGNGTIAPDNFAFIYTSGGSADYGFYFQDVASIRATTLINSHRFNIYISPNSPTTIIGALSSTSVGNSFQFASNAINGNPSHSPTSGTWNFFNLLDASLGANEQFNPTSGTAVLNCIHITPTLNQTSTATGVTRGVYDNPTFSTTLSRQLHRSFESNGDSNSYSLYAPSGAMLYNAGTIETAATLKTAQPSGNGAGLWKLGKKVTATVALVTTDYIEIDVDGVVYKLGLVS